MRLVGPNCLGVMNPISGVNATFAAGIARRGNVAFISQSGALCTAVLDWSLREMVGFSAFVSIGSMLDVGWGDLISYFGDDPEHQEHRHLHGEHRRRARVPFSGPRGGADQAHHRHQARPDRRRRQGRRLPHRLADRLRRRARSRLQALRRAAREQDLRPVLHVRGPLQATPAPGQPAHHHHQCRRPGRAGDRCPADHRRRPERGVERDHGRAEQVPPAGLEP